MIVEISVSCARNEKRVRLSVRNYVKHVQITVTAQPLRWAVGYELMSGKGVMVGVLVGRR